MANIGTFTADKDGFTGTLRTLTLNVKAKLVPNDKGDNEKAPDFRVQAASHDYVEFVVMRSCAAGTQAFRQRGRYRAPHNNDHGTIAGIWRRPVIAMTEPSP
jgi:hypothetical protein